MNFQVENHYAIFYGLLKTILFVVSFDYFLQLTAFFQESPFEFLN